MLEQRRIDCTLQYKRRTIELHPLIISVVFGCLLGSDVDRQQPVRVFTSTEKEVEFV